MIGEYQRAGTEWEFAQQLTPLGPGYSRFGWAMDVVGGTAFFGGHDSNVVFHNSGAVYQFERLGGQWVEPDILTSSDLELEDSFGGRLAFDGRTLVVGAPNKDMGGVVEAGAI